MSNYNPRTYHCGWCAVDIIVYYPSHTKGNHFCTEVCYRKYRATVYPMSPTRLRVLTHIVEGRPIENSWMVARLSKLGLISRVSRDRRWQLSKWRLTRRGELVYATVKRLA